jgi:hypothetical protein
VDLVRTEVSEERSTSTIRVKGISQLGKYTAMFLQDPHGVTSQKKTFFIATAVKVSDLL